MTIEALRDKLIAIAGFGREGKAVLSYLQKNGIKPTIFDERAIDQFGGEDQDFLKSSGLNFVFGKDSFKELSQFNVVFRSPGVHRLHPDIVEAEKKGLAVTSMTKWFFEHCPAAIIGVTGTKGKGTTCTLIYEMLTEALRQRDFIDGRIISQESSVFLTGNIGKTSAFEILQHTKRGDVVVYELSSFQLQDLDQSPHIGVCLMVTSDHLDVHMSQEEYVQAKEAITKFQSAIDFAISNIDYPASRAIGELGNGIKLSVSREDVSAAAFIGNGVVTIRETEDVFDTKRRKLRGDHNLENIAAAALAAIRAGAGKTSIQKIIEEFKGLEHRLELVTEKNGVSFYNDSISTTPESTMAAITSFSEPLILILGGSEKGLDFNPLARFIAASPHVKHLIVIGETAGRILEALDKTDFRGGISTGLKSMSDVFTQLKSMASFGDVVLLSPACASFDMFTSYADRGNQFKQLALTWEK